MRLIDAITVNSDRLTHLRLVGCGLRTACFRLVSKLAEALGMCTNLVMLSLNGNGLEDVTVNEIFNRLRGKLPKLAVFNLGSNELTDALMNNMMVFVNSCPKLECLHLSGNRFTEGIAVPLIHTIRGHPHFQCVHLESCLRPYFISKLVLHRIFACTQEIVTRRAFFAFFAAHRNRGSTPAWKLAIADGDAAVRNRVGKWLFSQV